jgi:hypothetical protein
LANAYPWALGEELFAESKKKLSAKNSTPRASRLALGEEIFKKSRFHLQTFSIINMHLYKRYDVQI